MTRALLEIIRRSRFLPSRTFAPFSPFPSFFFYRSASATSSLPGLLTSRRLRRSDRPCELTSAANVISNYRELDARRYRARYLGRSEAEDSNICVKENSSRPRDNEGNLTDRKVRFIGSDFSKWVFMNFHRSLRLRIIARTDATYEKKALQCTRAESHKGPYTKIDISDDNEKKSMVKDQLLKVA